ncbi:MAG: hypothetical protein ACR2NE_03640 [Pirellulales bacterium]
MNQTRPYWQGELPEGWLLVTADRLPAWMLSPFGATWASNPTICQFASAGLACDRVLVGTTDPTQTLHEIALGHSGSQQDTIVGPLVAAEARGWNVTVVTDAEEQFSDLKTRFENLNVVGVAPQCVPVTVEAEEESSCGHVLRTAIHEFEKGKADLLWVHLGSLGVSWDAPQVWRDGFFDEDDPPPGPAAEIPQFAVTEETDPDQVSAVRQIFAGELAHLDDWLGRLVATVSGRWQRFGMLLLGLRGIPLGLHGQVGTASGEPAPYTELTHVPAILVDPADRQASQRYGGLLMPVDLGATVGELIAGTGDSTTQRERAEGTSAEVGQSIGRLLEGDAGLWRSGVRDRVYSVGGGGHALTVAGWSLVQPLDGPAKLFLKPDDYFDLSDVADRSRDVSKVLADCLNALVHRRSKADTEPLPAVLVDEGTKRR